MDRAFTSLFVAMTLMAGVVTAANPPSFAGEYADKELLRGTAVFQMSIEGSGDNTQVWFSAGHNNGSGAAPEGQGKGKIGANGTLTFKFVDSFNNAGTGTITRSGNDIVVSMKTTRVADSRCSQFYGQNMKLKQQKKGS